MGEDKPKPKLLREVIGDAEDPKRLLDSRPKPLDTKKTKRKLLTN
jgi:hypothetical protein